MSASYVLQFENRFILKENFALLLGGYGLTHALVDASCAATVLGLADIHGVSTSYWIWLIILYNVLAFGTQPLFGLAVDRLQIPKLSAVVGCVLVACGAIIVYFQPLVAVVFVGVGNSLFHLGGGSISLNLMPGQTTAPGIFVAPGALGLAIGSLIGKMGYFTAWPFVTLLLLAGLSLFCLKTPEIDYKRKPITANEGLFELILLLLLFSVTIRSLIGLSLDLSWKENLILLFMLIAGIVAGKVIGGIMADRFGWMKTGITALALSIPLLAFGYQVPALAILGAFLFQMTMPITLVAVATMFKGQPAFAFGLPCLALIIGALPAFTKFKFLYSYNWVILATIFLGLIALFLGLKFYFKVGLNTAQQKV